MSTASSRRGRSDVATALQLMPKAGPFKMLTGAAIAYGITEGGAFAEIIELTDLGRRIVSPVEEGGDDVAARREALLRPRGGARVPPEVRRQPAAVESADSTQCPRIAGRTECARRKHARPDR